MEGKKEEIRKGPWKAEEDEVLMNHVKKYGPRDWSSIRSKGLLQRTGKSCRLRWVNKLRPNLKNGCKFSGEEERVVIDLQAQFGNKWAKIATYLPGRTDNDVKNFWSSRQKRLARILQNSASPSSSSSKSQKNRKEVPAVFHDPPLPLEAPIFSPTTEEVSSSKVHSCSPPYIEDPALIKMVPLPDLVKQELPVCDANFFQIEPQIPFPQVQLSQPSDLTYLPESQELLARFDDSYFLNVFGAIEAAGIGDGAQVSFEPTLFDPQPSCMDTARDVKNPATPDTFFEDIPADMFDHI